MKVFYCSYDNRVCRRQVEARAKTKADGFKLSNIRPVVIDIHVNPKINQDTSLNCVYFEGNINKDGLEWAEFIVFHRVMKDKKNCTTSPYHNHPDIIIGPIADGNAITSYANDVHIGIVPIKDFYNEVTKSNWFPDYRLHAY